jgi:hypothetical protein
MYVFLFIIYNLSYLNNLFSNKTSYKIYKNKNCKAFYYILKEFPPLRMWHYLPQSYLKEIFLKWKLL